VNIVAHLAEFVAALRWEDVPGTMRDKLEDHVVDTLGVMCAGTAARESVAAIEAIAGWRGEAASTVVATNLRLPPAHASFLNAFHARIHSYDDTLDAGPIHSGSVITAAALASAEANKTCGATLLAAILAGYEVVARIVAAFGSAHYAAGFHTTGTCNVFGAAAAVGKVRGLDAKALTGAMGIAGGMASGLRQYQIDGSISDSALNGAHAALAGVLSAELAAAGLAGPAGVLDGKFGLGTITVPGADFLNAVRGLGSDYLFADTAIKPFPTCRFTHGPLQVLARLQREHAFAARDVERIEITTFRRSIEVSDRPHVASRSEALLSHQTCAALLLTRGTIDLATLDRGTYREASVSDLAARVRVVHSEELEAQYPAAWPHRIGVLTRDGRMLEGFSRNPPGATSDPIPRAALEAKFRANASDILGPARAASLLKAVRSLSASPEVSSIAPLLQPERRDASSSRLPASGIVAGMTSCA
jgi:2-methylcitrate dehydratase PrpD